MITTIIGKKTGSSQNTNNGYLGYGIMSDFSLSCAKLKKRESSTFIINILKCFFSE